MRVKSCQTLTVFAALLFAALQQQPAFAQDKPPPRHNFPTDARADYVIGCLAANGMKRELLEQCACEIDAIANQISFDDYEQASTIMSMQQGGGPAFSIFRDTTVAKAEMEKLDRAQAEANLRCD